jgi:hypothetical protein
MTSVTSLIRFLSLAAAPTFAAMALATALHHGSEPDVLCSATQGSPLDGMVPMYLLMSAFHSPPWLKLIPRRRPPHAASWKMTPRVKRSPPLMRLTPWRSATR